MPRRALPTILLFSAALAGCGGAVPATPDATSTTTQAKANAEVLSVGKTRLRLGDAVRADAVSGTSELRVGPRRVSAEDLAQRTSPRDGVGAGAACADRDVLPDGTNDAVVSAATLCLLNGERVDAGLAPLRSNAKLAVAAARHSQDMVARQYFDHVAGDGRDIVDRVNAVKFIDPAKAWTVGENIGWGSGTLSTPANMVAAWMKSPGHKANVLHAGYREVGIGVVPGSPRGRGMAGAATYTTDFGTVGDAGARAVTAGKKARRAMGRKNGSYLGRKNRQPSGRKNGVPSGRKNGSYLGRKNGSYLGRKNGTLSRRRATRSRGATAAKAPVTARVALGPKATPPGQ